MDSQSASLFAYVAFDEPPKEILAHGPTATDALRSADKAASDAAIYILASEPLSVALSSSIHTYHENQSAGTKNDSMRQSGGVPKLSRGFSRWITLDALWQAAANAIEQFKQNECRNFFTHAGYYTT